jgi:hypothetical protein
VRSWDESQGRFYGAIAFAPIRILDAIKNPDAFQATRLGLVALTLALLAILVARVSGSVEGSRLWCLVWIGCLQIPPTFYGLLSYPELQCGMICVLAAALGYWGSAGRTERVAATWASACLFFGGLLFHEAFLAFALMFVGLAWWRASNSGSRMPWRSLLPFGLAVGLYLCIYVGFRAVHRPTYEGTQAASSVSGAALYVFRYTLSSFPGFELLINRDPRASVLTDMHTTLARLGSAHLAYYAWAAAIGIVAGWSVADSRMPLSTRRALALSGGLVICALVFMAAPSLSAKYQAFAHRRLYPHAYNFIMTSMIWLAATTGALGIASRLAPSSNRRRAWAALVGLSVALASFLAQVSNPLALHQIEITVEGAKASPNR